MDSKQLAQATFDAFNDRSFTQKAKDQYAPNVVVVDKPTGQEFKGPDGYVQYAGGFIAALPDLKGTVIEHKVNGNTVTTRIRGQGTFTGKLHTPQGDVPGTGKKLDLEYQAEQQFNDAGKIVRAVFSFDQQAFAKQLGLG